MASYLGYDYSFNCGLNTIKEENGYGKTTFASFIKAMFYGMETKRNTKALIDRKKYMPWQGGAFGGNIEFEINGKRYKLERFFGKKENEDTFKLYDLSTNLETSDFSENIGEEIFGLNKEAYERSTFVSGQDMETSMNDSINAKLGNILESENDVNTSEKAIDMLDKAIKNYKKTGSRGKINELALEKANIEKKLEQSKIDEKNLQERKEKYNLLKNELKEKEEERSNLNKLLELKIKEETQNAKLENYKMLQNNLDEARKNLEQIEQFFKEGVPTDEEIETLIEKSFLIEKYKVEVANYENSMIENEETRELKEKFNNNKISEKIINEKISDYKSINDIENQINTNEEKETILATEIKEINKQRNKDKIVCIILGILILIGLAVGIYGFISQNLNIITGGMIFSIIIAICTLIKINSYNRQNKKRLDKEDEKKDIHEFVEKLKEKEYNYNIEIEAFADLYLKDNQNDDDMLLKLTEIKTLYNKYEGIVYNQSNLTTKQREITEKLNELEESIKTYFSKYFENHDQSYVAYAQEMKVKKSMLSKCKQDFEAKLEMSENYKKQNNIEELVNSKTYDMTNIERSEIEEKIRNATIQINTLNDEKNYLKNQIELLESNLDGTIDIENRLNDLEQTIEEMKRKCEVLEITKKFLETAKEQFSSHYLSNMKKSFVQKLKIISQKDIDVNLDVNLNVTINEQGSAKEMNYFSTGYKDLIYISMRLSLADCLFEKEKPFIILDDPFANLDENKIKNALNLLNKLSEEYQIIYFVCHESRK